MKKQDYRTALRLSTELYEKIKADSDQAGIGISAQVRKVLEAKYGKPKKVKK